MSLPNAQDFAFVERGSTLITPSPLGTFAPGFKEVGKFFKSMVASLEACPEEYGFLGASGWLNSGDRGASSQLMTMIYFSSYEGLHKFAHGPEHQEGWKWWHKGISKFGHIGLMHEVFRAPKGHWEGVYVNYHPTGLAATSKKITRKTAEGNVTEWVSPVVDASKGLLRTSYGRMGKRDGSDNDKYGDPYVNQ
jgi:hypothetical protein